MIQPKTDAAIRNAIYCMPTESAFMRDLAQCVTNSGNPESAAEWLLTFISRFLEKQQQACGPIAAFDFAWPDIESICQIWPLFQKTERSYRNQGLLTDCESPLPKLARFLIERMPAIWSRESPWFYHAPVTRALVLADRADTLVGLFAAGLKPNGSKDPFALRRAANHLLRSIMFPVVQSANHKFNGSGSV